MYCLSSGWRRCLGRCMNIKKYPVPTYLNNKILILAYPSFVSKSPYQLNPVVLSMENTFHALFKVTNTNPSYFYMKSNWAQILQKTRQVNIKMERVSARCFLLYSCIRATYTFLIANNHAFLKLSNFIIRENYHSPVGGVGFCTRIKIFLEQLFVFISTCSGNSMAHKCYGLSVSLKV